MLNSVNLQGRLVADPQVKQTQTGKSVCSFRIACERNHKDGTDFIDVVVWDKTADFVGRYFGKGTLIALEGRLQTRNYQDRNGNKRTAVEVLANNVYFCQGKNEAKRDFAETLDNEFLPLEDGDLPF